MGLGILIMRVILSIFPNCDVIIGWFLSKKKQWKNWDFLEPSKTSCDEINRRILTLIPFFQFLELFLCKNESNKQKD